MKQGLIISLVFVLITISFANLVDSSIYPAPFVIENSSADVAIIYGTSQGISSLEIIQAGNIQTNLEGKLGIYKLGEVLVKDTKLDLVANKNLIVLGTLQNGCSNSAIAKMLEKETCNEVIETLNLKKGEYLIEVVNNPSKSGKIALLLVGYSPSDLVEASSYLRANSFDTSIGSNYTKKVYISEDTCIDSDGENYSVKGNVTFNGNVSLDSCGFFSNPDSMASFTHDASGKLLQEYFCDYYNHLASVIDECPYGCHDGACINTCTESWFCSSWNSCSNNQQTRTCTDANSCGTIANKPSTSKSCSVQCNENWQCDSWATCINNQQTRTCTDANSCGTIANKPSTSQICDSNLNQCESGCNLNGSCIAFGYRINNAYCDLKNKTFTQQKQASQTCENNFECSSNVCVSSKCVNPSLIDRILNWFRRLFGAD